MCYIYIYIYNTLTKILVLLMFNNEAVPVLVIRDSKKRALFCDLMAPKNSNACAISIVI
jgi:hypothetical protein